MTSAVRKKIEAGAGIPPSLRNDQRLWMGFETAICSWASDALGAEGTPELLRSYVERGSVLSEMDADDFTVSFEAAQNGGIAAVSIDPTGAERVAAFRLASSDRQASGAPSLFLRLLFERSATVLCAAILKAVGIANPDRSIVAAAPVAPSGINGSERYFCVQYALNFGVAAAKITIYSSTEHLSAALADAGENSTGVMLPSSSRTRKSLGGTVRESAIALDAVLDRLSLSLGECSRLHVGQVVPLTSAETEQLSLCASTTGTSLMITQGRLGAWKRDRAIMVKAPLREGLAGELAAL